MLDPALKHHDWNGTRQRPGSTPPQTSGQIHPLTVLLCAISAIICSVASNNHAVRQSLQRV